MDRDDTGATEPEKAATVASPQRRDLIRRLAKTAAVVPTAAVLYSASTSVAAAS